jgi:hypothetical protein
MRSRPARLLLAACGLSLLLHLLVLVGVGRWWGKAERIPPLVRYHLVLQTPWRVPAPVPEVLPHDGGEGPTVAPLGLDSGPQGGLPQAQEDWPGTGLLESGIWPPGPAPLGGKPGFVPPVDRLPSPAELNEQEVQQYATRAVERARYARLRLPDVDTTDAESQNRRQAQAIVDRAIAAMGGVERMLVVRDKTVAVFHYNSETQEWLHAADRYYLWGQMFRQGLGEGSMGYDGIQSWHYRYGVLVPAPGLRYQAERLDFLSQFKGEGIFLQYGGRRRFDDYQVEVVVVEDLKYGTRRLAYFDMASHLLKGVEAGALTTRYEQYKWTGGILTLYEYWERGRGGGGRYRQETSYDTGLEPAFFQAPRPRTWDPDAMVRRMQEGGSDEGEVRSARRLKVAQIYQRPPRLDEKREVRIDRLSLQLLNTYLFDKLRAAGVLAQGEADYQVGPCIEEFWVAPRPPPWPPLYTMRLSIEIKRLPLSGAHLVAETTQQWKPWEFYIDDKAADVLTDAIISSLSRGLVSLAEPAGDTAGSGP